MGLSLSRARGDRYDPLWGSSPLVQSSEIKARGSRRAPSQGSSKLERAPSWVPTLGRGAFRESSTEVSWPLLAERTHRRILGARGPGHAVFLPDRMEL